MPTIKLTALQCFLGMDGTYLVPAAGKRNMHPTDYFHPEAYKILEEFKETHNICELQWSMLQTDVGGIRIGRSLYEIKKHGALFITTDIRAASPEETNEDFERGLYNHVWSHKGTQYLAFFGDDDIEKLAEELFEAYKPLACVKVEMVQQK
jgi:hypothetical protein